MTRSFLSGTFDRRRPATDRYGDRGGLGRTRRADSLQGFVRLECDGWVRRFIANADDRPEDDIERADTALAGVAAQSLGTGSASHAFVYTTDVAAGRAVEAVFDGEGYGDSITYVNAFRLIEDLLD